MKRFSIKQFSMKSVWLVPVLLMFSAPVFSQDSSKTMLNCMTGNILPATHIQEVELTTTRLTGATETLKGKLFTTREKLPEADGLLRAMLQISAPEHLAGAAYLVRQTEDKRFDSMYVYLPSVRRVRRISTDFVDGSLLGTTFSYYEFKQLTNAFAGLLPVMEAPAKVDGRGTDVMLFSVRPETPAPIYSAIRVWVDQKTCVPLKAEFYKGESVRKRFSAPASALKQAGKIWYLSELEMRDLIDDTRTVLKVTSMTSEKELPARLFDPNTFYLRE